MAVSMAAASVCAFLQMLFFKHLATAIGPYVSFYFFGMVCLLTALYAILVVPETKLKTVEEIYQALRTKKEKREIEALKEMSA